MSYKYDYIGYRILEVVLRHHMEGIHMLKVMVLLRRGHPYNMGDVFGMPISDSHCGDRIISSFLSFPLMHLLCGCRTCIDRRIYLLSIF
jgi:hypothetical protein